VIVRGGRGRREPCGRARAREGERRGGFGQPRDRMPSLSPGLRPGRKGDDETTDPCRPRERRPKRGAPW